MDFYNIMKTAADEVNIEFNEEMYKETLYRLY